MNRDGRLTLALMTIVAGVVLVAYVSRNEPARPGLKPTIAVTYEPTEDSCGDDPDGWVLLDYTRGRCYWAQTPDD